jgi:predicted nucleic acid-binding protein
MSRFVLDTSVAVAWYLPESFAAAARLWQTRMLDGHADFIVPSLHYWEFANLMRTHVRGRTLEPTLAHDIWTLHLDAPLETIEPPVEAVLGIALDYEATVYDAVYIALAIELDLPILTAERNTTPWVKRLGKRAQSILR